MKKISGYLQYIVKADYRGSYYIKKLYYSFRYLVSKLKIFLYCKWNRYPVGKIFLEVPTSDLQYTEFNEGRKRVISSRNIYKIIGKVIGGDWDQHRTAVDQWSIYTSLEKYFKYNIDLKNTPYYSEKQLSQRHISIWDKIHAKNYVKEVERNKRLYTSMEKNGYQTQKQLGGFDYLDEVRVKIARDGTFLWENSIHRFVIAKILGIESITVVVTVRHIEWVRLKKKLIDCANKNVNKSQRYIEKKYTHPDLQDIPYSPEGDMILRIHLETHIAPEYALH
jgi:hypothetical protein